MNWYLTRVGTLTAQHQRLEYPLPYLWVEVFGLEEILAKHNYCRPYRAKDWSIRKRNGRYPSEILISRETIIALRAAFKLKYS